MPYCMGTLYWVSGRMNFGSSLLIFFISKNLNDIWQGFSWSSLEYNGDWKLLHHFAAKFFSPVLLSSVYHNNSLEIWATSDWNVHINNGKLVVEIWAWNKCFSHKLFSSKVDIAANSSQKILTLENLVEEIHPLSLSECFVHYSLNVESQVVEMLEEESVMSSNLHLLTPLKKCALESVPIQFKISIHGKDETMVHTQFDHRNKHNNFRVLVAEDDYISKIEIEFTCKQVVPFVYWTSSIAGVAKPANSLKASQKTETNGFFLFPNKKKTITLHPIIGTHFNRQELITFVNDFCVMTVRDTY